MDLLDRVEAYVVDAINSHGGLLPHMDVRHAMLHVDGKVDESKVPHYYVMLRVIRNRRRIVGKRGGWHYRFE
jgi:hypothetical protein